MSKATSPTRFSGDLDHFYDANFTADISHKMRVPKRIKVDGEMDDHSNTGSNWNSVLTHEKLDMHVPDRILVAGQEQHIGTKAPPRELILENAVMPPDPGIVRVQTPPRVITLDEHYFPSADDFLPNREQPEEQVVRVIAHPKSRFPAEQRIAVREPTPPIGGGEGLTPSEELVHLRRQMAKLNRRVMAIELDSLQRQQREKIIYAIGLAYFFFKTVFWLARSS